MASLLRSSKFVRYIAGFARNVVANTPKDYDGSLINNVQCYCGAASRSLATQATTAHHDQSLERSLLRIDQDVRKAGRISRRDIEDVLEEIRSARSATSSQSLLVIRCCGNLVPEEPPEVRTELVQEIWNTLLRLDVPMDVSHHNALLRVYLENEHPFSPAEFLRELEARGVEPNRVTYQRLVARCCQAGDIEGATKILEFMREKQMPVNENVFNALINGHSQAGDMDSAHGILAVMAQAGLEPSTDTYTTLLCGYSKKGDIDSINKLFEECERKEILFLDKDYLDIVYSLAVNGHKQHVPTILSKVRKAVGYNQDAVNLCLRLINKGLEDAGLMVLQSMVRSTKPDGTPLPSGNFFVKQLVKANRPVEKIIEICNFLEKEQLHERALSLAAEYSLGYGNDSLAYALLSEMKKRGLPMRQHYFWPLIISKANAKSDDGIIQVLIEMSNFNVIPSNETLREYVIPHLSGKSSEIIAKLREANISVGSAACSLLHALLTKNDIKEAAIIASSIAAYYKPEILKRPLTTAFHKTKDLDSYITILRCIYDNLDRKASFANDDDNSSVQPDNKAAIVGSYLIDLTSNQNFDNSINSVLEQLVEQGLSITTMAAEKIQDKLGEKMTDEISTMLGKLTSGELTPVPVEKKMPSYIPSSQMNIPQLERLIQNLENKNQDTKQLKRQLFNLYYRAKDLENTEKLLEQLEKTEDFTYTAGMCAQLIELYAYHNNLEKAENYLNKLKEVEQDFRLDDTKIIRLVQAYINQNRLDDGIKVLESMPRTINTGEEEERSFSYSSLVWRMLNSLAEKGLADDLDKLFNALTRKEFIRITNIILGPLIKVHIVNEDLGKALEKFEWCVQKYQVTPWKNELTCKLIQSEDAEKLQKLTDLSTSVHGEINSLYDLVFAFVECGRIRQARKILETPGLHTRANRINSACERYRQEGLVKPLEGLKDATKDLNHIDRSDIYYQLLLSYVKQEDVDKAVGLWTQMQEEDLQPTDEFLQQLAAFLTSQGLKVPFIVPAAIPGSGEKQPQAKQQQQQKIVDKTPLQLFRNKLRSSELDGALELRQQLGNGVNVADDSLLIEKLVQNERLNEATKIAIQMLDGNVMPVKRVFKFLLNRLAGSGDVATLQVFSEKLDTEAKKIVSLDNKICHAKLVAGQAEEYLSDLEKKIDSADDDKLQSIGEEFPRGGAFGILENHPELVEKFETLAVKYVNKGIVSPANVLWTYHFINGNYQRAETLWKEHLQDSPRIMFQRIVQTARESKNEDLIKKLIEHLKISNVTEGAIGNAYSCYLDVLVSKDKHEETIDAFEKAIKDVNIDSINRTAVLRIKDIYNKLGKPFNHKIPVKTNKSQNATSSSSSSSSDDEKKK